MIFRSSYQRQDWCMLKPFMRASFPEGASPLRKALRSGIRGCPHKRLFALVSRPPACRGLNGVCRGYQPTGKARVAGRVAKLAPCAERLAGQCGSIRGYIVKA
jgi:hypothetical protein